MLGPPTVKLDGQAVSLSGKSLALLCYLALEGESRRSDLARLLWSQLPGALARRNLRRELHRLRATGLGCWLWATGEQVGLHPGFRLDLRRFRALRQAEDWLEAAALLRGPPLGDLHVPSASGFGSWQGRLVARLTEEQLEALGARAHDLARQGRTEAAQWVYARMLRLDPLRESTHRDLMALLFQAGEAQAALVQHANFGDLLARELALAPLPETVALLKTVALLRTAALHTPQAPPFRPEQAPPQAALAPLSLPFTGRAQEMQTLARTRVVLVTGEAGAGKTRLLQEFLGQTEALWLDAAQGQMGEGTGRPPFAALAGLFRSRPELLQELEGKTRAAAERLAAGPETRLQTRPESPAVLEGALWTLLGRRTLVAEDLHAVDSATLGVVERLIQRNAAQGVGRILLSICTPGPPAATQATQGARRQVPRPELGAVLGRLEGRGQLTRLPLGPLGAAQVAQLLAGLAGQAAPLFAARLHQATAGHPLFLLEALQALRESGRLDTEHRPWQTPHDLGTATYDELPLPSSLADAVLARILRLGGAAERVLGAAAAAPEPFGAADLQAVCALGERETLALLERAAQAGLLRQTGGEGLFRFSHGLYRQALLDDLDGPRRGLLETRLGLEKPPGFRTHSEPRARPTQEAGVTARARPDHERPIWGGLLRA